MSTFLSDAATPTSLEYEQPQQPQQASTSPAPAAVATPAAAANVVTVTTSGSYEYHLPHTKTIDLIGDEFAPRKSAAAAVAAGGQLSSPNVVVVSAVPAASATGGTANLSTTSTVPGMPLIQAMPHAAIAAAAAAGGAPAAGLPVSVISSNLSNVVVSTVAGQSATVLTTTSGHPHQLLEGGGSVTVDLPTITTAEENGGVLLCNLDELSRYIPENFYTDFNDTLEATTATVPTANTVSAATGQQQQQQQPQQPTIQAAAKLPAPILSLANGATILQASPVTTLASSTQVQTVPVSMATGLGNLTTAPGGGNAPITIQLPTQPQPVQAVKTVTYATTGKQPQNNVTSTFQPVKLATTGIAYTATGERVAIKGLPETLPGNTVQVQMKHPQTFQLQGLNIDPSKLTVVQELPDVGKVVIQEQRHQTDSISNILEEMKTEEANNAGLAAAGVEYATAIPVAVTNLKDPQKGLKRMGPASTILLPDPTKKGPTAIGPGQGARNIIFAGNTLPQGAIPVQISGLNAFPVSAVKSIPLPINLSTLTPTSAPVLTTTTALPQVVAAKKSKVDVVPTRPAGQQQLVPGNAGLVTTHRLTNNNNNTLKTGGGINKSPNQGGGSTGVGNNKTCNWQFENGEVCGKTFSKSYNLVVHMRMHEDVRPFQCGLCDQTFRQKAHLQRHETTHGVGVKVGGGNRASGGNSSPKRRRKRSNRGGGGLPAGTVQVSVAPPQPQMTPQLQERLARVSEQFGTKPKPMEEEDSNPVGSAVAAESLFVSTVDGVVKTYSGGLKRKHSNGDDEDDEDAGGIRTVVTNSEGATVTEIIELKDGAAFLAAATGDTRKMAVKLKRVDEHGNILDDSTTINTSDGAVPETLVMAAAAAAAEDNMKDPGGHIIEAIQDQPEVATSVAADQLSAAVNEAVGNGEGIIDEEEVKEDAHKDLLGSILTTRQATSQSSKSPSTPTTTESEEAVAAVAAAAAAAAKCNVHVEVQPDPSAFPPVATQEYTTSSH